ncbi:helix-turn-helix domain-containing protein [Spirillospora sp. CA-128828]|uniref:helix-turn-helix domain-containing protein n=1 Tax=Spirillospora sp. CA-128828 TaxID=3240033 RepID=UPI003D8E7BFA
MSDPRPWTDPQLRAAWAKRDWARILKRYRDLTGLTQSQLEAQIGVNQPYISNIERRVHRVKTAAIVERITLGLGVPAELSGVSADDDSPTMWQPPVELRERIAHSQSRGRVDMSLANWIADVLATYRRAEDNAKGRDLWTVVRSQLDAVTERLPDSSGKVADGLLTLAAEHAHWLSWVAAQENKPGPALAWLDLAQGWAIDAGAEDLTSWVTRVRSYYALDRGDPIRALRTAELGRRNAGGLTPAAASAAAHQEGLAAAALGERDRARSLADEALDLALRAPDAEERPGWLYWLDPVRAQLQRADMAYAVRDWSDAAAGYAQSLDQLREYPRDHAYYSARYQDARSRTSS